jgi:hypothetical protein
MFLLLLVALFISACSSAGVVFKNNYGDIDAPGAEQALQEIVKNSNSIIDYSSKIFESASFKNYVNIGDDYVKLNNFSYAVWIDTTDYEEARIDRAFGIYCKIKYSAKVRTVGNNERFCYENIDSDTVIYIEKAKIITKRYSSDTYNYDLKYTENKEKILAIFLNKIQKEIKSTIDAVYSAKNSIRDYSTSFSPLKGLTIEYILNYKGSELYTLTRIVKNNTNAPFVLDATDTGALFSNDVSFAIVYKIIDGGIIIHSDCPILQSKQSILINPGMTCKADVFIEISGFSPDKNPFTISYLNQSKIVKVTTLYDVNKEHYDNMENKLAITVKNIEKKYEPILKKLGYSPK